MVMSDRIAAMIDEREGRFRVDRAIYSDPDIFESEMELFFEEIAVVVVAIVGVSAELGEIFSVERRRVEFVLKRVLGCENSEKSWQMQRRTGNPICSVISRQ